METKIRTNNVILNAVVPSYVTLVSRDLQTFMTCVTFHVNEFALEWLPLQEKNIVQSKDEEFVTFTRRNKRGIMLNYVTIRRKYNSLDAAVRAAWTICAKDKDRLKIWIREASIAQKKNEIDFITKELF